MAWFIVQSWLIIIPTFVLGLLVGWLWWGRRFRKVGFGESEAVQTIARQHQAIEADKDAEITRLRALLSARTDATVINAAEIDATTETVTAADADSAPVVVPVRVDASDSPDAVPPADDEQVAEAFASDANVDDGTPAGEAAQSDADLSDTTPVGEAAQSDADLDDTSPVAEASTSTATAAADAETPPDAGEPADGETSEAAPAQAEAEAVDAEAVDAEEDPDDDLERVEGIGPRIAGALRAAGIRTFAALAAADVPTLQAALEASGLRFAPSLPTWARQAGFLAAGDEEGFVTLTDSLVAGRSPSRRS